MMRIIVSKKGKVKAICNDVIDSVMNNIGKPKIRRLSNINYNNKKGRWEIKIGRKILNQTFSTKSDAVAWEIAHFNVNLHKLEV